MESLQSQAAQAKSDIRKKQAENLIRTSKGPTSPKLPRQTAKNVTFNTTLDPECVRLASILNKYYERYCKHVTFGMRYPVKGNMSLSELQAEYDMVRRQVDSLNIGSAMEQAVMGIVFSISFATMLTTRVDIETDIDAVDEKGETVIEKGFPAKVRSMIEAGELDHELAQLTCEYGDWLTVGPEWRLLSKLMTPYAKTMFERAPEKMAGFIKLSGAPTPRMNIPTPTDDNKDL